MLYYYAVQHKNAAKVLLYYETTKQIHKKHEINCIFIR